MAILNIFGLFLLVFQIDLSDFHTILVFGLHLAAAEQICLPRGSSINLSSESSKRLFSECRGLFQSSAFPNDYSQDSFIARPEPFPNPHLCCICNTVFGAITNSLFALKTNLTDSCDGGSPSRLAINES